MQVASFPCRILWLFLLLFVHTTKCFQSLIISIRTPLSVKGLSSSSSSSSNHEFKSMTPSQPSTSFFPKSQSASASPLLSNQRRRRQMNKDVVIVGGGLSGLSTAIYLSQIDPGRQITILERNSVSDASNMASLAAAGMLAPHSERLPKGDYLDLCLASKKMFSEFASMVESLAQEAGPEGANYLSESTQVDDGINSSRMEPWNIGYVASGGFLAPAFAGDNVATWAPPEYEGNDQVLQSSAVWLDATQVRELEPHIHPDVVGGWWFPEDASVDAQRLIRSLKAACVGLGVDFLCGPHYEVTSLDLEDGNCAGIWLKSGKYVAANSILVANGAWMRNLLPVPLEPHKGQSLSLRMPKNRPPLLRRVLFAQDSYIVPKADGRVVVGATVEAGSFDANVTPAGIMHILSHAIQLVPGLADLPLENTWAGLRPTTPDKAPILGETPWNNLYLAGGNWRNGVLLAPITGQLLASLIASKREAYHLTQQDERFLNVFAWSRFTSSDGSKTLAANARYAASMYPIHTRRSGVGVAAAVGTELGSYSSARLAGDERKRDRESLFGSLIDLEDDRTSSEEAFERAAQLGLQDANAFQGYEAFKMKRGKQMSFQREKSSPIPSVLETRSSTSYDTEPYDGSADAITVGTAEMISETKSDGVNGHYNLRSIYDAIASKKAKQKFEFPTSKAETKPDPGFRIYHVDRESGKQTEVPPYTSPGDFLESLRKTSEMNDEATPTTDNIASVKEYDENSYDGYQSIQEANGRTNRTDELKVMKQARQKNRLRETNADF